jgi:hypothetical protein
VPGELLRWNVDDTSVFIEADEVEADGWVPAAVFGTRTIRDAQVNLEDALAHVGKAARAAMRAVQEGASGASHPAEIEVRFGVKFGTEAGAIIARTSLEGQLDVTMRWRPGDQSDDAEH